MKTCNTCGASYSRFHQCKPKPKCLSIGLFRLFPIMLGMLFAMPAKSVPLTPSSTFSTNFPYVYRRGQAVALTAKGTTDNEIYMVEIDPTTGAIPTSTTITPALVVASWVESLDYGVTPVTTAAYVQLNAATVTAITYLSIFDSSGNPMILAVGAPGSEVDQIYVPPGGSVGGYSLYIPAGSRISYKALTTNSTSGNLIITGLN
jgi:hypothetical protein